MKSILSHETDIHKLLEKVGCGVIAADDVLSAMDASTLTPFLRSRFSQMDSDREANMICRGDGILDGDVSGILVLSREVANACIENNRTTTSPISYIYAIPEGDIEDFLPIKHAVGFFTNNKAKTVFSPVQAVQEGIATVIGVPCSFHNSDSERRLKVGINSGEAREVATTERYILLPTPQGKTVRLNEGDMVSLRGHTGEIYSGDYAKQESIVAQLYSAITKCYLASRDEFGPHMAWQRLCDTDEYRKHADLIHGIVSSSAFRGFQAIKKRAIESAVMKTLVNAHNAECVVFARLVASDLFIENSKLVINTPESAIGVGLLRDERMWIEPSDIDLLRMLLLGPEAMGEERFARVRADYISHHSNALFKTMSVGTGNICVARTLCMPFSKFLPDSFDIVGFCQRNMLDVDSVRKAFSAIAGEREVYHGCRGVRLFCVREDIAESWLTALLVAAKRTVDAGIPVKLRILLATLTLPEEVDYFLRLFDRIAPTILGDKVSDIVVGISSMLETTGAYLDFENIYSRSGRYVCMNGGLVGTNDFTAACLNMNRADSPRLIIPGYVKKGIFSTSPFKRIHPMVGKAIVAALRRSQALSKSLRRDYTWGLSGELAYDWDSARWLALHAAKEGLDYISTGPETLIPALFAAHIPVDLCDEGKRVAHILQSDSVREDAVYEVI